LISRLPQRRRREVGGTREGKREHLTSEYGPVTCADFEHEDVLVLYCREWQSNGL